MNLFMLVCGVGLDYSIKLSTRLPAVVGWNWHQHQRWEDRDQGSAHRADVHALYFTTDVGNARRLIEKYGVRYVYVGQAGLKKFEQMARDGLLQPAYPTSESQNPEGRICRVLF